jgi:hypothetical protein
MSDDDDDDLFGTDPHILHRAEGPDTSVIAAYTVKTSKRERQMFEAICSFGSDGCIADDLIRRFPTLAYSTITARPSALERKGLICRGPDTRMGKSGSPQHVMRKSKYADFLLSRLL